MNNYALITKMYRKYKGVSLVCVHVTAPSLYVAIEGWNKAKNPDWELVIAKVASK